MNIFSNSSGSTGSNTMRLMFAFFTDSVVTHYRTFGTEFDILENVLTRNTRADEAHHIIKKGFALTHFGFQILTRKRWPHFINLHKCTLNFYFNSARIIFSCLISPTQFRRRFSQFNDHETTNEVNYTPS